MGVPPAKFEVASDQICHITPFFPPHCSLNVWLSKPVDSRVFPSKEYFVFPILRWAGLSFSAFANLVFVQFLPPWPRVTGGAVEAPRGLMWVPALFCFFNRGRKSRVSHPSRPLPGAQTTGEESTSPRAAYEASGQVCIHSSFGQSACCPPSTSHPTLLALYFSMSVSSFSLHMLFLSISLTPTLFTPPSLLSLHLFCLLSGCWAGKPRLLEWKFKWLFEGHLRVYLNAEFNPSNGNLNRPENGISLSDDSLHSWMGRICASFHL